MRNSSAARLRADRTDVLEGAPVLESSRGIWAVADQGIVSLGSFATGILLARHLPLDGGQPRAFGAFAVLFEVMLYLNGIQSALVIYPLLVRGAKVDRRSLQRLTAASCLLTLMLGVPLAGIVLGAAVILRHPLIGLIAAGALVLWQLQETVRRALMAHLHYGQVIWGDALRYLGQAGALWLLARWGNLTLTGAFGVMGATSALALILQVSQVGLSAVNRLEIRQTARNSWDMGRWILFGSIISLLTSATLPWTMAAVHGLGVYGVAQALSNLLKFSNPVIIGVSSLVVPAIATASHASGNRAGLRSVRPYAFTGALVLAPLFALVMCYPGQSIALFYPDHLAYQGYEPALRVMVLGASLVYVSALVAAALNGLGHTRHTFYIQVVAAAATLLVGVPATVRYGIMGFAGAALLVVTTSIVAGLCFLGRAVKSDSAAGALADPIEVAAPIARSPA